MIGLVRHQWGRDPKIKSLRKVEIPQKTGRHGDLPRTVKTLTLAE